MKLIYIAIGFILTCHITYSSEKLDNTHRFLSASIFKITNRIDSFFGSKYSLEESNGSHLRYYYTATQKEYTSLSVEPNIKINIRLKELERKLSFNFERTTRVIDPTHRKAEGIVEKDAYEDKPLKSAYIGSVALLMHERSLWHLSFDSGVKFGGDFNPFVRFRGRRNISFKSWEVRLVEEVVNYSREGLLQFTTLDFNIPILDLLSFRFTNNFSWRQRNRNTFSSHGPSLYQIINSKKALSYNIRGHFKNDPIDQVNAYDIFVSYRQLLYKKWFFYETTAGVSFLRKYNFYKRGYISAKVEAIFGTY